MGYSMRLEHTPVSSIKWRRLSDLSVSQNLICQNGLRVVHIPLVRMVEFLAQFPVDYLARGGARGVMFIVIGNGHGDTSPNPGQD